MDLPIYAGEKPKTNGGLKMDKEEILYQVKKAFDELDKIPEFTDVDFTGEADQFIRDSYNNLDEAIVRLRDLIKRED